MTTIYLGLGSNLGDRAENLRQAIEKLAPEISVTKVSPVYETEPMYGAQQAKFLNAVVEADTGLAAMEVLRKIKAIEKEMGEHEHNGPRTIDLDVLFYANEKIETPELTIPHSGIAERAFVLMPMNDIAPDFVHPVLRGTIAELLAQLADTSDVQKTNITL